MRREKQNNPRILITGGGTGGHIFPLVAVVSEIKKLLAQQEKHADFFFLGPAGAGLEELRAADIDIVEIPAGKVPRYATPALLMELFKMLASLIFAVWHIWKIMPDAVFSKGGFGGFSSTVAAWMFRIPVLIHESDAVPGLANRISSFFAKRIAISFPYESDVFPENKTFFAGNPVRTELAFGSSEIARDHFKITSRPTFLILGGSQGSQEINAFVVNSLLELLKIAEVIHQCGTANFDDVAIEAKAVLAASPELAGRYHPVPFLAVDELAHAYAVSDLVVSRAGAGSIFELAYVGKPGVLIPLETAAAGHQLRNAEIYTKRGAAIMLVGENAKPHMLLEAIKTLMANPFKLEEMSRAAKDFAKPDAATVIAKELLEFLPSS